MFLGLFSGLPGPHFPVNMLLKSQLSLRFLFCLLMFLVSGYPIPSCDSCAKLGNSLVAAICTVSRLIMCFGTVHILMLSTSMFLWTFLSWEDKTVLYVLLLYLHSYTVSFNNSPAQLLCAFPLLLIPLPLLPYPPTYTKCPQELKLNCFLHPLFQPDPTLCLALCPNCMAWHSQ